MSDMYKDGFFRSLLSNHIVPLTEQVGEVAIDMVLTNENVKSIPLLGSAVASIRLGNDIRAYFFTKKIAMFLNELDSPCVRIVVVSVRT